MARWKRTETSSGASRMRRRRILRDAERAVFIGSIAAVVWLGMAGFRLEAPESGTVGDHFYATMQLFVMEYNGPSAVGWQLAFARLLAPVVAAYTVVRTLAVFFGVELQRLRLRLGRHHAVVAGLGDIGLALVRSLREGGFPVVAIEADPANPNIGPARELGALVLFGAPSDPTMLARAQIRRAGRLISVCADAVNAEMATEAARMVAESRGSSLECRAHVADPRVCRMLMAQELAVAHVTRFRIEFFNIYQSGARALLDAHPVPSGGGSAHVVLVGCGPLADSVAAQLAHDRLVSSSSDARITLSMVGADASVRVDALAREHPALAQAADLVGYDLDVAGPALEELPDRLPTRPSIYLVCPSNDDEALAAAVTLQAATEGSDVPVVAAFRHRRGAGALLGVESAGSGDGAGLRIFGVLEETCDTELLFGGVYEKIARALHMRYLRAARTGTLAGVFNEAAVEWDRLPAHLRESNRRQAAHIGVKLQAARCRLVRRTDWSEPIFEFSSSEVELLGRLEHERWVADRREMGWKAGSTKDVGRRRTPYLVPFDQLPSEIQEHDRMFVRGLPGLLARIGYDIVRDLATVPPATGVPAAATLIARGVDG